VFNVTPQNNNIIEGPQNVTVTAHATNWIDGSASMTILDDDLGNTFHFTWGPVSSQLIGEPFGTTLTAQDPAGHLQDYRLGVTIDAAAPGSSPGTNTVLNSPSPPDESFFDGNEYVLGYAFTPSTNLVVTQFRHYFGDKVALWTDGGQLLASLTYTNTPGTWMDSPLAQPVLLFAGSTYIIVVHENNVDYFWDDALPTTFADGTIDTSCWDYGDVFPTLTDTAQWYFVDLRYSTDASSVAVSPGSTGNFTNGVWSGNVTALQPATNAILRASMDNGRFGQSNPFNVLGTPKLTITTLNNSAVLSWPAAAAGFNLMQTSDLSNWTSAPGIPTTVGDRYYVTNALGSTYIYYRLLKP
jgi:hypothetical protein